MAQHTCSTIFLLVSLVAALASCSGTRSTLVPRLAMNEEYTDNVDLSSVDPASAWISTVSPGITYGLARQNEELTLSYDPSFAYYAGRDEYLATRHAAELNALDQFSRHARIEFNNAFMQTDDPSPDREPTFVRTDEPPPPVDNTIRTTRDPYFTNTARTRFRYDFGARDFMTFDYSYSLLQNDDPTVENNTRQEPSLALTYWLTPDYGVESRLRYTHGDFTLESDPSAASDPLNEYYLSSRLIRRINPALNVFAQYVQTNMDFAGVEPDYQVYDASAGFDYHLSRTTFVTLSGGYFYRTIDEGEPTSGYVLRGDMAKEFSRGSLRVTGGIGYDQAFFGAENLGFTKFYSAGIAGRYQIYRNLAGEATADYRDSQYTDVAGREDKSSSYGGGLNYQVNQWLSMTLRLTHHTVDSTLPEDSYDENRISFGLTLVPAQPIRLDW